MNISISYFINNCYLNFRYSHDPNRTAKYAALLNDRQKEFLLNFYREDFDMFGFSDELLR